MVAESVMSHCACWIEDYFMHMSPKGIWAEVIITLNDLQIWNHRPFSVLKSELLMFRVVGSLAAEVCL